MGEWVREREVIGRVNTSYQHHSYTYSSTQSQTHTHNTRQFNQTRERWGFHWMWISLEKPFSLSLSLSQTHTDTHTLPSPHTCFTPVRQERGRKRQRNTWHNAYISPYVNSLVRLSFSFLGCPTPPPKIIRVIIIIVIIPYFKVYFTTFCLIVHVYPFTGCCMLSTLCECRKKIPTHRTNHHHQQHLDVSLLLTISSRRWLVMIVTLASKQASKQVSKQVNKQLCLMLSLVVF